jgi:hypothetical protein
VYIQRCRRCVVVCEGPTRSHPEPRRTPRETVGRWTKAKADEKELQPGRSPAQRCTELTWCGWERSRTRTPSTLDRGRRQEADVDPVLFGRSNDRCQIGESGLPDCTLGAPPGWRGRRRKPVRNGRRNAAWSTTKKARSRKSARLVSE